MIKPSHEPHSNLIKFTMLLAGAVLLLMMIIGLLMRAAQGDLIEIDAAIFYQLMTAHGAGMVGAASLTGAAIMWYFVSRYVHLVQEVFVVFLTLFLFGVLFILGSISLGQFGAGWTFLFPLPAISGGAWQTGAAAAFIIGLILIGVGFLLMNLEIGRKLISTFDGIGGALAWPVISGKVTPDDAPPPAIVASMATIIFNTIGIVVGAAVLVSSLINLYVPSFEVDALLAKNMIYFFGHIFINATIYMAVVAVYEIIPEYTGKPWKTSRIFAIAWSAILLFVMAVYPHHLLQDTVMPAWALIMGQIVSYLSGIPLLTVTAFSLCIYLRGSNIKWDLASALLVLGVAGWSVGVVPAIIDGMISVNKIMHNTQWVPGHFHIYLLLGEVAMSFGFMAYLIKEAKSSEFQMIDKTAFGVYLAGGIGFTLMFLVSGAMSVPRRWAVHAEEWMLQDRIATAFALLVIVGALIFVARYIIGIATYKRT